MRDEKTPGAARPTNEAVMSQARACPSPLRCSKMAGATRSTCHWGEKVAVSSRRLMRRPKPDANPTTAIH